MPSAKLMQAGQLVIEGRVHDAAAMARALHDQAVAVESDADAAAVTQRLTAALLEVLASVAERDPAALERALVFIEEARQAGRPAWMAVGRAVAARVMVQTGLTGDVLTMLALAELDLEEELGADVRLDPLGEPTGPGAAANNLGVIYHGLGLMDRAERHLLASLRASSEDYGPAYRGQVGVDLTNLLAFRLGYALEKETDEDVSGAAEQARSGLALVEGIRALASDIDWPILADYARVLELGCLSVVEPSSVPPRAPQEVRALLDTYGEGGLVHDPMSYVVLARVSRLTGDVGGAARAAQLATESDPLTDGPEQAWAWREAALAAANAPALAYAGVLRRTVCRHRADISAALEHRIEMVRLERTHAEVRDARERLEQALNEAGEQEALLQQAASHDPLTGLLNRSALQARLGRALADVGDSGASVAVAFIDLDGFKQVNDRRGHTVGDRILATVAVGLRSAVRDTDALARYGGDEFVCVREGVRDPDALLQWADRLRQAVEECAASVDDTIHISASIGLCVVSSGVADTPSDVIAQADAAMYAAKRQGPGQVRVVTLPVPAERD